MNSAMAYIENHLHDEIDFQAVARIACCSAYHFQRFFFFFSGIPLSEYVRRRRLTLAAFDLQNSDMKVIDAALKYGYESPEAFGRAFKNMHGVIPSAAKEKGVQLKAYPCLTFHILIKGDVAMNYRIEQKEAFGMFGVDTEVSTIENQNYSTVPKFWETCRADGSMDKIRRTAHLDGDTPLHAAMFNCTDTSHTYLIGHFIPENGAESGALQDFTVLPIPASTWAIFLTEELSMVEAAQQSAVMWKRIFSEWFATSGYELTPHVPEFELHHKMENGKYVTEIHIPICTTKG
jgi:AraC family transcriptional regulator